MGLFSQIANKPPEVFYHGSIANTYELKRVFSLPRRHLDLLRVEDISEAYVRSESRERYRLRPVQCAALIEASQVGGLFGMIGLGEGKSLIGLALPDAMEADKAVYLVKPDLKAQLQREIESFYDKHFSLPLDRISIVSYTELSSKKSRDILEEIHPDLIVADEAHCLKHPGSARTRRFLHYAKHNPSCRYAFLSGTMTTRSLKDYAHLIELALGKNSPLPGSYNDLRAWAGAFDADPREPYRTGYFDDLAADPDIPGDEPAKVFYYRLVQTKGVVATEDSMPPHSLYIRGLDIKIPTHVMDMIKHTSEEWEIVDPEEDYQEEFSDASERWRHLRELGCGFYYVWDWPKDAHGDRQVDYEWLEARTDWNREVRQKLKFARPGLDTPSLLEDAAEAYHQWLEAGRPKSRPELAWDSFYWPAWREQKKKKKPPQKAKWVSDFMIKAVAAWIEKNPKRAIVWYEHVALGERIAKELGLPLYGAGTDAGTSTAPVIVCSMESQGTGKNLQLHYSRNLFTSLPPNGSAVEQTFGRTHRLGQVEDEVWVEYFLHTGRASMEAIKRDALYVQSKHGTKQRVLHGTHVTPVALRYLSKEQAGTKKESAR